ncbi:MAG: hypothetical protein E4H09_04155, partial [Spirochaetales bacterium]
MNTPKTKGPRSLRPLLLLVFVLLTWGTVSAQESAIVRTGMPLNVWLTFAGIATAPRSYDQEGVGFSYESDAFTLRIDGILNNDQKYTPSETHMRGRYFDLRDGSVRVSVGDFGLTAGRMVHTDEVFGPYSLFISSMERPTTAIDLRYDNGFFFYGTRWLEL